MSPDETIRPNEIACVEANKLIVHFKLTDHNSLKIECSLLDLNLTDDLFGLKAKNSLKNIQNISNQMIKHSFLVPHSFNLNELKLPNNVFNCNSTIKTYSIYYFFCFAVFFAFVIFCWCRKTVNKFQILIAHRKIVTFYLSIFVEKNNQDALRDIVRTYIDVLKL